MSTNMDAIDFSVCQYDKKMVLKPKQRDALDYLFHEKGDLIVSLPVGYGKSVIYHLLPSLLGSKKENPVVLVISPLNIIQKDQVQSIRQHGISCCRLDIKTQVKTDDSEVEEESTGYQCSCDEKLDQIKSGKYQVILCHPEALLNTDRGRHLLRSVLPDQVIAVVVDECHVVEKC